MLPTGRSVAEQIFACDEGVMGYHNDRRASEKMPANGRSDVTSFIFNIFFTVSGISDESLRNYKLPSSRIS